MHFYGHSLFYNIVIQGGNSMETLNGTIKQLVKTEELAKGGINLTIDSKMNIWSRNISKIDNIFALVLNMLKEQRLIAEGIEEHSLLRPRDFDKSKVVLFAKNKDFFDNLNLPKELLMGERLLGEGDEELLNYLLENIIDNARTAYDRNLSTIDRYESDNSIDEETKDKLAVFYSDYNAHYKKPYIFVMIEDISMLKNTKTIELLKKMFELGRSKNIVCYLGSIIDGDFEFLSQFATANVTLVDKMSESDREAWYLVNSFGLGDLTKLDIMNDEDYLCLKGNLFDQGRGYGIKPYILTIREYEKENVLPPVNKRDYVVRKVDVYNEDFSLLNTFPNELAEYRYSLQDETIKYMANFSDLRRIVVRDIKTLVTDYLEFDTVDNYDILLFLSDNLTKFKNEFNYRMGEYISADRVRNRNLRIERCFSLGRNMEIIEYIKLRQDDSKIEYDWQINAVILAKTIMDLWNSQNDENKISKFHFYKYPKEYRKKYGYNDEWYSQDLM